MAVQEKAWMTSYLFSTWMSHFIKNVQRLEDISPDHQHLLILDGHNSHVTLEVVREAKAVGLDLVTLPSHTSHALQPLDVSVFKPFKTYFQLYRDYWSRHNLAATPSKQTLAQWSSLALRKALSSANIKAGFRATGIWPMDREAIQRHLQPSTIFREPCHDHDPAPGSQEQALESENEDTLHDQNVQVEASEQQEGGGEQSLESTEIAMHLAEEPIPTTEHFFVDVNHADPDVPDEMGSIDPDVEAVQSSTRFLTLPSLTRRVNRNPRDPMIDFTKSIMLTSDEYVTAVEAARQAKINATKEKERLREEKEQRKKKKAADREEEKKERQARALIIAEARALQAREREETRANRQEACAMHSREELVLVLESRETSSPVRFNQNSNYETTKCIHANWEFAPGLSPSLRYLVM